MVQYRVSEKGQGYKARRNLYIISIPSTTSNTFSKSAGKAKRPKHFFKSANSYSLTPFAALTVKVRHVAKFIVPYWGIKSTTALGCRTNLCSLMGRYDNHMPQSTLSPQSGTMNRASDGYCRLGRHCTTA